MISSSTHFRNGQSPAIYDVLYGFIPITEWEEKIINSPFFQRLRWIKQLGFANYIFPGAEHNRFAHVIGVMHSMDQMIHALGINAPQKDLFNPKSRSESVMLHKCLRIAALLHDIGTFPFSHAIEFAYLRHGNDTRRKNSHSKNLPNSHEHLGSFIIKNTDYKGGITQILEHYGLDVNLISHIIKGDSKYLIANQLMHSDLDADRMDYLIRDAHYTGIKYGHFDREYILANLVTFDAGQGQMGFGVTENAAHAVEDFLFSRFSWYSQIIKNQGSAKFDIMSSHVAKAFLDRDWIYQFHDLLQLIEDQDERFYWFNDLYFMTRCQELHLGDKIKDVRLQEWVKSLLYRQPPKTLDHPVFRHRILNGSAGQQQKDRAKAVKAIQEKLAEFIFAINKAGAKDAWILGDIPEKDVVFTKGLDQIKRSGESLVRERDPVKIVAKDRGVKLLVQSENSLMRHLSGMTNFVPSVYGNEAAAKILRAKKLL